MTNSPNPKLKHVPEHPSATGEPPHVGWTLRRFVFCVFGLLFVALGVLGALLPLLPTTPFLLLASYFFVRSSPRLHAWLLRSRIFGPFLRDWQTHGGVRRRVKVIAVVMIVVAVSLSIGLGKLRPLLVGVILVLASIGLIVVLRLPVIDASATEKENAG